MRTRWFRYFKKQYKTKTKNGSPAQNLTGKSLFKNIILQILDFNSVI